jgi:inner membrane protein
MKAPAHIATGITFTGVLCSIFDINIFQSYAYTSLCVIFSLLPDIDTTKSTVGKLVWPVAKLINRKFGHRTITHSALFLLFIFLVLKALYYFNIIQNNDYYMIIEFAALSHIILDMFTVSGVPFFYPFVQNACVIPGNPDYRFNTGDMKSELVITGVCGLLSFTMQPLFQNGFWTSYNRSFGTIKHVHRENNNTDKYTLCDYSYIDNNIIHEGTALVIESRQNEISLFDKGNLFVLNADDHQLKVNYTKPRPSNIPKQYSYIQFYGITLDSLQQLMTNSLCTGLIQSNYNIEYIDKAVKYNTNFVNIKNRYNFHINAMADTTISKHIQLLELEASQKEEQRKFSRELGIYNKHIARLGELEITLKSKTLSYYERNKLQNELISLRQKKVDRPAYEPSLRTQVKIDELRKSLNERTLQFSGHLTVYKIVDPSLPEVRQKYREINENLFVNNSEQNRSIYNSLKK